MKCHCGLECSIDYHLENMDNMGKWNMEYYRCPKHCFQGWVDTEGFELLD